MDEQNKMDIARDTVEKDAQERAFLEELTAEEAVVEKPAEVVHAESAEVVHAESAEVVHAETAEVAPEDTMSKLVSEGVAGLKELNAAHRAHAEARDNLERLQNTIHAREQELEHRRDIEARYPSIIDAQTACIEQAQAAQVQAEEECQDLLDQVESLKNQLEAMKDQDAITERRFKSHRITAEDKEESARDAEKRLQRRLDDANRNLKRAKKEQSECVATAQKTIVNAEKLLDTLNDEFAKLQRNPSANPAEYSVRSGELQHEIADATNELLLAKESLPRIEYDAQQAVEEAMQAVAQAEQPMPAARAAHKEASSEADNARDAFNKAKADAAERQKALSKQIAELERKVKETKDAAAGAQNKMDAAQELIDEANDIHANPDVTETIARALEADRAEYTQSMAEVEQLAAEEDAVRTRTRGSRAKFLCFVAGIAVVIILMIVWLFVANK